jgi:putative salt-induced outer membrane protein
MRFIIVALVSFLVSVLSISAFAAEPFAGEAEAGAIVVSGNSESENYNAKTKLVLTQDKNIYTAFGRYLQATANGVESSLQWEAGARYERELTDYISVYLGYKSESDIYNGYVQRDSSDIGGKYYFIKSDTQNWIAELGYRYSKTNPTGGGDVANDSFGRLFSEYNQSIDKALSFKYWVEYLPNLTDHDAYLANTEASLNVMLNSVFSMKFAYLLQYQNVPPTDGKYTTSTTTMNLVAKF